MSIGLVVSIVFFVVIGVVVATAILYLRHKIEKKNKKLKNMYLNGYWVEDSDHDDDDGDDDDDDDDADGHGKPMAMRTANKANLTKLKLINTEELAKSHLLGKGAFGSVYEAKWFPVEEKRFHIKVAIKELRSETTEEKSQELIDEAKIMATVNHPHCLRLIGNNYYYVLLLYCCVFE
jgi:hypothetical protein